MAQCHVSSPSDEKLDFDDDTLRAIADVYLQEGNKEYKNKELFNAICFYTEGLQVNCKDDNLNAKLYSNRATAYFHSGNYQETLNDATAAIQLEPTFIKAIERGASACVQLQRYKEAITWCQKGLAIDKNIKTLLELWEKCVRDENKAQETIRPKIKSKLLTHTVKDQKCKASLLKTFKDVSDKTEEKTLYGDVAKAHDSLVDLNEETEYLKQYSDYLGIGYYSLRDIKRAIKCHERDLKIAREVGDTAGEGRAYGNLGNVYDSLGDFKKAIEYHERHLKIAKEVGDTAGKGGAYANLGCAYCSLGDFKKAIEYHERDLKIAKEMGDTAGGGRAYGNLGNAYHSLGDFKKAIEYHERHLKIAKEVEDSAGEGRAYANLGNAYHSLGDFKKAIEYHERHLKIAKELGDTAGEGGAYGNLGNAYDSLGDFKKAIEYHERDLKIAKEVGDTAREGSAYGNLGNAYDSQGEFKKAIEYHERDLKIAKEVGDTAGEGETYGNLGNAYQSLGDFEKAIEYHERCLKMAKEVGDTAGEGSAYGNLGNAYRSLGDFKTAIEYHECRLKMAKEVGDTAGEGRAYGNLGCAHHRLGEFKKAIEYHERDLKIAKEVGDTAGVGGAYGNLGNAYHSLGNFKKAIEYHERRLKIAKEVGDTAGEGRAYGNLGNAYHSLGDFKKAIEYHERDLKIAKEVGDTAGEAMSFYNLGHSFELEDSLLKALDCYHSSVRKFNDVRRNLLFNDEWKISYRNMHNHAYTSLWRLLLEKGEVVKALFAAEQGRAQALQDLMNLKYASEPCYETQEITYDAFSCLPSNTVFMAIDKREIILWIIQNGKDVQLRREQICDNSSEAVATTYAESLIKNTYGKIGVRGGVKCEDRSLDRMSDEDLSRRSCDQTISQPTDFDSNPLRALYDVIIGPISDLIHGNELIFVPVGPLCLAPYAAFLDSTSKYLCEDFKIRVIPSLGSLKLITDCSTDYHRKSGALLVGDPCLEEVLYQGKKLMQLPCAKAEVEMIGKILHAEPLTGKEATKDEVLRRLPSVALVHIAAHGHMETGEIALAPNTSRAYQIPNEEDFLLTMKDVLSVQLRARLVVLSCCHSGRGEIKAEGVVGIARAFLGAGARSVLVSLWAIDDEATLEFMKSFYRHLAEGRKASEALNRAMKCMRDSDEFSEVKYWAPFVLIGDDVTLDLDEGISCTLMWRT
ncbi:uncharacterized protein LOC144663227 [Oculina patagonica]